MRMRRQQMISSEKMIMSSIVVLVLMVLMREWDAVALELHRQGGEPDGRPHEFEPHHTAERRRTKRRECARELAAAASRAVSCGRRINNNSTTSGSTIAIAMERDAIDGQQTVAGAQPAVGVRHSAGHETTNHHRHSLRTQRVLNI